MFKNFYEKLFYLPKEERSSYVSWELSNSVNGLWVTVIVYIIIVAVTSDWFIHLLATIALLTIYIRIGAFIITCSDILKNKDIL